MITIIKDNNVEDGRQLQVSITDLLVSGVQTQGFKVPFTMSNEQVKETIRLNIVNQIRIKTELDALIDSRKDYPTLSGTIVEII